MSLEAWKTIFEIGGVMLLFLTFVAGAGALWTSRKINDIQSERLRNFDKDLTDAKIELGKQQERAAVAETELAKLRERVAWRAITPKQRDKFLADVKIVP